MRDKYRTINPLPPETIRDSAIYPSVIVIGMGVEIRIIQAMSDATSKPITPPTAVSSEDSIKKLQQNLFPDGAESLTQSDFESSLRNRYQHDVHHKQCRRQPVKATSPGNNESDRAGNRSI